jgi:hypothetical protein
VAEGLSVPKASILRQTVFAVALLLLIATPSLLFIAAVSTDSTLHDVLSHITVLGFPLWATFAVLGNLGCLGSIQFCWTSARSIRV